MPSKSDILAALQQRIALDLEAITTSQQRTQEGATHEEARPESDKDTRATESSYLARGLAKRVSELRTALSKLATFPMRSFDSDDAIAVSALVVVEEDDAEHRYFVAPAGGGISLVVDDLPITVVTPASPLGRALIGQRADDEIDLATQRHRRELTIVSVH